MSHDIAYTLQALGMIQKPDNSDKPIIVVDWQMVTRAYEKAEANKNKIKIDPECLRWTPLISPIIVRQIKEVNFFVFLAVCNHSILLPSVLRGCSKRS